MHNICKIPLYGPFAINIYGIFIIIGLLLFSYLVLKDSRTPALLSNEKYFSLLSYAIIIAFFGGRILFVATHYQELETFWDIIAFWEGGFSLLGSLIALLIFMPWYLFKEKIALLPFLDLLATYAPLLQAVSRIGCFFAGCCSGIALQKPFTLLNNVCCIQSHPTQLYSTAILFIIFLLLWYISQWHRTHPGQLFFIYLIAMSTERFVVDFWRADREFIMSTPLSVAQLLSLILCMLALVGFSYRTFYRIKGI